jgi:hypothetical protein
MAANLVQRRLFSRGQEGQLIYLCQRLRQEGLGEIQLFLAADDVFYLPVDSTRGRQRRFIRIIVLHLFSLPLLYQCDSFSPQRRGT